MPKHLALFYREHMNDYVVNERGLLHYEPKSCVSFRGFEAAVAHILKNYSQRPSELVIDEYVREKRMSELERKLGGTKVEVKS